MKQRQNHEITTHKLTESIFKYHTCILIASILLSKRERNFAKEQTRKNNLIVVCVISLRISQTLNLVEILRFVPLKSYIRHLLYVRLVLQSET